MVKLWLKVFLWCAGIMVFFSLLGSVLGVVSLPFHLFNNAQQSAHDIIDKTVNADNIIFNYEFFHDKYHDALMQKENIDQRQQDIDELKQTLGNDVNSWSDSNQEQLRNDMDDIASFRQMYNNIVSEYNSNSHKINHMIFKDKGLPYELPMNYQDLQ